MKNIRTALVLAAALCVSGVAFAQAKVVPAQSQITFAIKEMGVAVEGKFTKWTADVAFDPKKPETGKVAFTITSGPGLALKTEFLGLAVMTEMPLVS